MVEVESMSDTEKYGRVLSSIKSEEYVAAFVETRLGRSAADEYRQILESGIQDIPDSASPEQKYETAYRNWMWIASTAFAFVRERMGEEGIDHMVRAGVEQLKKDNAGPSLYLLGLIRAFSPGLAFEMVAKQSVYEFQYLTPYAVNELSRQKVVMSIPACKILDYPNSEDICLVGCRQMYPRWMAEQLKVKLEFDRQGSSCTATITPLH